MSGSITCGRFLKDYNTVASVICDEIVYLFCLQVMIMNKASAWRYKYSLLIIGHENKANV